MAALGMGRRGAYGLLIFLISLSVGCRLPPPVGTKAAADDPSAELADSLEQFGDLLQYDDPQAGDEARAATLESRLGESALERTGGGPRLPGRVMVQSIQGARSDTRARIGLLERFEAGYRTNRIRRTGFFSLSGLGPADFVDAGNLRADFAEGLALGGRDPNATPLCAGRRQGDLQVRPSLSLWERTRGVAAAFRFGRSSPAGWSNRPGRSGAREPGAGWQIAGLGWDRFEPSTGARQREGWLTISLTCGRWWWGTAMGFPVRFLDGAGTMDRTALRALSAAMRIRSGGEVGGPTDDRAAALSAEAARLGGELYFVIGGSGGGGRHGRWFCRLFRQPAPSGYGGMAGGLVKATRTLQGGSCRVSGRIKGLKSAFHLYDGTVRSDSENLHTCRLAGCFEWRPAHRENSFRTTVSYQEKQQRRPNLSPVTPGIRLSQETESRVGWEWTYRPSSLIDYRLRMDYRFDERFRAVGILLSVGSRVNFKSGDAEWRVTNYSLEPGHSSYLSRPGIGAFEQLAVVYRYGSDISLRIRFRLRRTLEFTGFYGQPWGKERRLYLGGCWTSESR